MSSWYTNSQERIQDFRPVGPDDASEDAKSIRDANLTCGPQNFRNGCANNERDVQHRTEFLKVFVD